MVYVVAHTSEDERYIRSLSRADLLPLHVDLVDPYTAQEQLARFRNLLAREHRAFDHAEPHKLKFTGFILIPDTQSTPTKIEDISSEEWSDGVERQSPQHDCYYSALLAFNNGTQGQDILANALDHTIAIPHR